VQADCASQPPGLNVTQCMPPYSADAEEKEPFGPSVRNGTALAWIWQPDKVFPFEFQTQLNSWDGDGYSLDLPCNYSRTHYCIRQCPQCHAVAHCRGLPLSTRCGPTEYFGTRVSAAYFGGLLALRTGGGIAFQRRGRSSTRSCSTHSSTQPRAS
jgi:hypothetical protein